jgi:hypothetical protein
MKPRPHPRAASLNRFFSIGIFHDNCGADNTSSEVTSRISAVTASHKLTSDIDNGRFICLNLVQ